MIFHGYAKLPEVTTSSHFRFPKRFINQWLKKKKHCEQISGKWLQEWEGYMSLDVSLKIGSPKLGCTSQKCCPVIILSNGKFSLLKGFPCFYGFLWNFPIFHHHLRRISIVQTVRHRATDSLFHDPSTEKSEIFRHCCSMNEDIDRYMTISCGLWFLGLALQLQYFSSSSTLGFPFLFSHVW